MPPGILCADLAQALAELIARHNWTPYKIHLDICRDPLRYSAPQSFSMTSVQNAIAGRSISMRTRDVMTAFVRSHDPTILPLPQRESDIDLATFFYVMGPKLPKVADSLVGHYQTYARSTTAEGYIRRGHISIMYDARKWRLTIAETQYRPPIDGYPEVLVHWTGFIAPKTDHVFALMRTRGDLQDATPMFLAMRPLLRDGKTGCIRTMAGFAMHYEPERSCFMYPTLYMERCPETDIVRDFVPMHDIESRAVRVNLMLGERMVPPDAPSAV